MRKLRYLWRWFLARFRLSQSAVCEMSRGRDWFSDFHDYPDTDHGKPRHFEILVCRHCGKEFAL